MKDKTSVSHDEVMVRKLRKDRAFAAEYLKAAMEDTEEPQALLVALRHVAARCCGMSRDDREARRASGRLA
jgi:DNA-binding phage protein